MLLAFAIGFLGSGFVRALILEWRQSPWRAIATAAREENDQLQSIADRQHEALETARRMESAVTALCTPGAAALDHVPTVHRDHVRKLIASTERLREQLREIEHGGTEESRAG